MLQVAYIRENKDAVLEGLKKRFFPNPEVIDEIIALDDERKSTQGALDDLRAESNRVSKEIGQLFREGKRAEADALKDQISGSKDETKRLEDAFNAIEAKMEELLLSVPNIPHSSVPAGKNEADNEVFQAWDKPMPQLFDGAQPHWELASKYNIFDLELGTKITGAGFPLYRGKGAKLQRSLIQFFLDINTDAGYEEIMPPLLVNADTARATGQLPDKEGQMYHCERDELYLIPTAEVPVTNIYRDVILDPSELPIKLTGYTPCFRREAGSYGAHVRGLNRVHQFDKVEIVRFEFPENSYKALEEMVAHVSGILDKLELPYRILRLCGGDMGFTSALTFDFEVWSAAQERWLEVSSVSNFETFQSHRMKLRYRDENKKTQLAHTLNGSALALARIVAALLENNQTPEGIKIPAALQRYTGFDLIS
ncbi:MAG: serine--tRNA ligase [Saprospiraceae bacterium]|nr:serine--tRNA ligase [Saprospiraceae bacterium]